MRFSALVLLGLAACASTPPQGPFFHDDRYLRFGVDPDQEAKDVIESQKERDYRLSQRLVGQHFTALGFMDKAGRSTAVRILTLRGVQVALDSSQPTTLEAATRYALLSPPIKDTHDADRDGFEEVFIEERRPQETCLRVYRVRDVGFVDRVYVDDHAFGQPICARAAVDLDRDGIVELWTEVALEGFPVVGAATPQLSLPLWAAEHRFITQAGTQAQKYWLARERAQREAALSAARQQLDLPTCYVLALELAGLEYLEHGDPSAQVAELDRAMNGLVLSSSVASAMAKARTRIFSDWNNPALQRPAANAIAQASAKEAPPVASAPAPRAAAASAVRARTSAAEPPAPSAPAANATAARSPAASASGASAAAASSKRTGVTDLELQRALRAGAQRASATVDPGKANPARADASNASKAHWDEPALEEGELLITPESAAEYAKTHPRLRGLMKSNRGTMTPPRTAAEAAAASSRGTSDGGTSDGSSSGGRTSAGASSARGTSAGGTSAGDRASAAPSAATVAAPTPGEAGPQPSAAEWTAARAAARELGNAAVAERLLANEARVAAAAERREAQAARERALQAGDPAAAAEIRLEVAAHVEAAKRHAEEAEDHAAQAAMHRAALAEHRELMRRMFGVPAAPAASE